MVAPYVSIRIRIPLPDVSVQRCTSRPPTAPNASGPVT